MCPRGFECIDGVCVIPGTGAGADGGSGALRQQLSVVAMLGEAVAGAPVLVRLTPERIDYQRAAAGGSDLRFTAGGQPLAHEIERWDPGGESIVWVKLPVLETGASFEMTYGGGGADSQSPAEVWSAYDLVYHLSDGGADSRGGFDATAQNGATSGPGQIGGAAVLDGVDDHFLIGEDLPLLRGASAGTMSAWIRTEGLEVSILEIGINGGVSSRMFTNLDGGFPKLGARTQDAASPTFNTQGTTMAATGEWAHVLGTADFAAGTIAVYLDGVEVGAAAGLAFDPATPDTNASTAVIGIDERLDTGIFAGSLDEVRCSSTAVSAAWVQAQYLSMTDALLTFGEPEPL